MATTIEIIQQSLRLAVATAHLIINKELTKCRSFTDQASQLQSDTKICSDKHVISI